jgi:hypothetical protein
VQEFAYDTRYTHNHYIQLMVEMGLVGLASYVAMAVCAAAALWKLRKTERAGLCAPLAAAVVMLYGHAVVEATWSFGCYLAVAVVVFAAIVIASAECCRVQAKAAARVAPPAAFACLVLFSAAISGYVYASSSYSAIQAGRKTQTAYTMTELARVDVYQGVVYKLNMAVNAATSEVPEFYAQAGTYAAQVRARHIYDFDVMLAQQHYFARGEWEDGVALLQAAALEGGSLSSNWQTVFSLLEAYFELCPDQSWYAGQVLNLKQQMDEFNQGRLEPVSLSETNLAFVTQMEAYAG